MLDTSVLIASRSLKAGPSRRNHSLRQAHRSARSFLKNCGLNHGLGFPSQPDSYCWITDQIWKWALLHFPGPKGSSWGQKREWRRSWTYKIGPIVQWHRSCLTKSRGGMSPQDHNRRFRFVWGLENFREHPRFAQNSILWNRRPRCFERMHKYQWNMETMCNTLDTFWQTWIFASWF